MSAPAAALLQVQGLRFAYAGQAPIASDWSISITGGVTLLQGDTGSGKTTLLRCLSGDLPAAGLLTLDGAQLGIDRDAYRRRLFKHPLLSDRGADACEPLTARACTALLGEEDAGFDATEWEMLVAGFALVPHLDKPLYMLSTGSKRKVWLAAGLASGRALVLLDEPGAALDSASIRCLHAALGRRSQRRDAAVIVASAEPLDGIELAAVIRLPLR